MQLRLCLQRQSLLIAVGGGRGQLFVRNKMLQGKQLFLSHLRYKFYLFSVYSE